MLHMGDKHRSSWHQDAHWRITSSRETQPEKTTYKAHASSRQSKTLKTTKKTHAFRINPKPKRTSPLHIRRKLNKNTIQRVQCLPFVGLSGSRAYFTCGTALHQSFYNITDLLAIPTREKHDIPRLNKSTDQPL
jgi:hypothetical protein